MTVTYNERTLEENIMDNIDRIATALEYIAELLVANNTQLRNISERMGQSSNG